MPVAHPFADLIGLHVAPGQGGRATGHVDVGPQHLNPHGVVHGAVLVALADTTMGSALYTQLERGQSCATIELKSSFVAPVREGRIEAEAEAVRLGRSVAFLECRLRVAGQLVLTASASFAVFAPRG